MGGGVHGFGFVWMLRPNRQRKQARLRPTNYKRLQGTRGKKERCKIRDFSLHQIESLVWTKHRGAVTGPQRCRQSQGRSSVLRVPAAAVAASPSESPSSAPRQPFHAARDTQLPLTDMLCSLKQELAKCVSHHQTVLRENSEEPCLKIQETPLKIKPL